MIPSFTRHRKILLVGDMALMAAATALAPGVRTGHFSSLFDAHTGACVFTFFLCLTMLYVFDLYNLNRTFAVKDTPLRAAVAVIFSFAGATALFYFLPNWKFGRGILLIQMTLAWVFFTGWRLIFSKIFHLTTEKQNVLVLGAGHCGKTLCTLLAGPLSPYRVAGVLDDDPEKQKQTIGRTTVIGFTHQVGEIAVSLGIRTAILAINKMRPPQLIKHLLDLRLKGITILDMPAVYEQLTRRVPVEHIRDEWVIFAAGFYLVINDYVKKIKRLIDFGFSTALLVISLPVVAVTALAIRLDSAGPVFFRQERVGKDDRVFTLWKFRSMRSDAEKNGAVWAEEKDPRITRVGKWIRRLRIDELPQLINVFRGEMSLIGPRPERPEFVKQLEAIIPYYSLRHAVKPGITGWAQVNYRYGTSIEDTRFKLEYDLYYVKNMSLLLDLKIILRTVGVILFGQGAQVGEDKGLRCARQNGKNLNG